MSLLYRHCVLLPARPSSPGVLLLPVRAPPGNAAALADEYPNDFARIIGLHTYSQSPHRDYDITLTGNWVERGGFRFEDFILTRRREENTHGND